MTRALKLAAAALLLPAALMAEDFPHYEKALESYRQQVYITALSEARAQLSDTPNHAQSWLLISRTFLKLGKCAEAGNAAAAAFNVVQQAPSSATAPKEELDKVLADVDEQCGASLELGRSYVRSKDFQKAAEYYRRYMQKNPADLPARLELAQILSWDKRYPESIEQYKRYLEARPKDAQAILGLSDVDAWSGDLTAAKASLDELLSREPNNADALMRLARVEEWKGDSKAALDLYQSVLKRSPGNDDAREGLDRVQKSSSAPKKAASSADVLAELEKTGDRTLYLKLGDVLYYNEDKVDEAVAAYRRYLRHYPDDDGAKVKLARILGWEKRYDEAVALFREYLGKHPDDEAVRLEMADILGWQNHHAMALSELDDILRQNPSTPDAYLASGDILTWEQDYPEAVDRFNKALEIEPGNERAEKALRDIAQQWSPAPTVRFGAEGVNESDINFNRITEDAGADFHPYGGRIDLSPDVKNHRFDQAGSVLQAREADLNVSFPLQGKWRWWGSVGALDVLGRAARLQGSLGVEGSVSTHTWVKMGYTSQNDVFDSDNLSALLAGQYIGLDSYNMEFTRSIPGDNEIRGMVSAGFLTDDNSRMRAMIKVMHQLEDAPIVRLGVGYKGLSYSHTSTLYWSPTAYSGPGVTAELERHLTADLSYKAVLEIDRITQTSATEASVQAGATYRPRKGFFLELTGLLGRGAGAASGQGTTNTEYRSAQAQAGYKF